MNHLPANQFIQHLPGQLRPIEKIITSLDGTLLLQQGPVNQKSGGESDNAGHRQFTGDRLEGLSLGDLHLDVNGMGGPLQIAGH